MQLFIQQMLDELGCGSVRIASSEDEALEILRTQDIDLALVDINLGGAFSYGVAKRLDTQGVPFVFVTSCQRWSIDEEFRDRARVNKPVSKSHLARKLREARRHNRSTSR